MNRYMPKGSFPVLGKDFFGDFFKDLSIPSVFIDWPPSFDYGPRFKVTKEDNKYQIEGDMPGFDKKEINVSIKENTLEIKAKKEEKEEGKVTRESIFKGYVLPEDAVTEKIQANYESGVLTISLPRNPPKEPEEPKATKIKVE